MKVKPRDTPDRDSKYMGLALIQASFSKDPHTQVGAVIVSDDNFPLGMGYNGPARVYNDDSLPWNRPEADKPDELSKYDFIDHAEINAIHHCQGVSLRDATLYVTAMPCPNCANDIIRHGISKVVYFNNKSSENSSLRNKVSIKKTEEKFKLAKVVLEEFDGDVNWLGEWIRKLESKGFLE